ncbi:hypothetical protein BD626DRAFT_398406 [Schizophyllum amplum]|uniref:Uncharacterized protein n=1 Tax=Schizophyllum amplum TaxID=97359 RepID=A0A550CNP7_9AGAR|nr:hypothetical protein BD626DRAFT_398406 [Auriculariopsis ampla]
MVTFLAALAALVLPSIVSALTLDAAKCYTLSRDGNQYLDSTDSVLKIQQHDEDLSTGEDKGVRFHFPTLENGWVAHNDHFVGTAIPGTEWSTNDSEGGTVALATVHINGEKVYLSSGPRRFIGSDAGVATEEFDWDVSEINCIVNT